MKKIVFLLVIALISCQPRSCRETKVGVSKEKGEMLYDIHCASCHGSTGDGKGPVAQYLWPKPRDFTSGIFKYRTTRGAVPSDIDILQTMKKGIPGTSMPGWELLGMDEWFSILAHVKSFSPRLMSEKPGPGIDIPEEPKTTPASVQEGRLLYEKSSCVACHGPKGLGDGPGAVILQDVWGDRIAPRDLTRGPLKWGNSGGEIYRSLMIGIPGTPMPGFEQTFTRGQLWSLVHYLQSIQEKIPEGFDPAKPHRNLIAVTRTGGEIPLDDEADAWMDAREIPVFLKPLWQETGATEWLTVKGLHNEKEIAFYIEWEDDQVTLGPEQKDGVAIQFPLDKISNPMDLPYLGMGSEAEKVNIWEWRAGTFRDLNAAGIGRVTSQAETAQNVTGKGLYANGIWRVILKRSLHPEGMLDAPITKTGYLSFGLWDGDLPKHQGPEAFSEWMIYELRD